MGLWFIPGQADKLPTEVLGTVLHRSFDDS